jgi:multimeric flavodoxin WrbA
MSGRGRNLDSLRQQILSASAIILAGPVYFGDRGSLAQSLIDFIAADLDLREACRGKIYAGVAVGAKRNGGQETTLIYQMLDMINLDFLAVGNSSETTTQYGGTAVAGDVGKLHTDAYGIETSIGTGQRAAQVAEMFANAKESGLGLRDRLRVHLWLLQDDHERTGLRLFGDWATQMAAVRDDLEIRILDIASSEVVRCIACDICPTKVGVKDEYRCIITAADDFFVQNHEVIVGADAILLCAYSPSDRGDVRSMYQQFIERTRYLRRDNYVLSDLLAAPFVITELSARQNLHLRMLTSIMRHNTVLHHPIIGMMHRGQLLNQERLQAVGEDFVKRAYQLTVGRYLAGPQPDRVYRPIGYEVSARRAEEDRRSGATGEALTVASQAMTGEAHRRLGR